MALASRAGAVVLDGYDFDASYRAAVAGAGRPVLAFDDGVFTGQHPPGLLSAALVVNASSGAAPVDYAVSAPGARLLLGPAHAPVRHEVRHAAARPVLPLDRRRSVLLTFGGSDPLALTAPCIRLLAPRLPPGVRLVAVVGGSSPWLADCRAAAAPFGDRVAVHYDTLAMGDLMAGAGLAVSAAGGTVAELAALAVPALLAVVADNQAPAAAAAGAAGMPSWCRVVDVRGGGEQAAARITAAALALWDDPPRRQAMSDAARGRVDGQGAGRIAQALLDAMGVVMAGR
ncbi:spore coat polysaccharide biosynthesis predicted glycosyltransferase SpsG [Azospirillum fermentarium]|nr:spore coat polysaccharide biosynthesis predicted glycosyltransferase SpsG [Azospirillum fermentarium]